MCPCLVRAPCNCTDLNSVLCNTQTHTHTHTFQAILSGPLAESECPGKTANCSQRSGSVLDAYMPPSNHKMQLLGQCLPNPCGLVVASCQHLRERKGDCLQNRGTEHQSLRPQGDQETARRISVCPQRMPFACNAGNALEMTCPTKRHVRLPCAVLRARNQIYLSQQERKQSIARLPKSALAHTRILVHASCLRWQNERRRGQTLSEECNSSVIEEKDGKGRSLFSQACATNREQSGDQARARNPSLDLKCMKARILICRRQHCFPPICKGCGPALNVFTAWQIGPNGPCTSWYGLRREPSNVKAPRWTPSTHRPQTGEKRITKHRNRTKADAVCSALPDFSKHTQNTGHKKRLNAAHM